MKEKITEKLLEICSNLIDAGAGINDLTEEQRVQVENVLTEHFKFKKIVWMDIPSGLTEDTQQPFVARTMKLSDSENPTYEDKVGYVYRIIFTPKMYNPEELYQPVKDGCVFAPTTYNPETFEPKQSITITWSPDFPQDIDNPRTFEDDKQMLRDMLEKVLNNPEEYRPKGYHSVAIRFAAL